MIKIAERIDVILERKSVFMLLISILVVAHFLTYPTVHNLTDESKYLSISEQLCNGNYTYFESEKSYHTPLFYITLCITSYFHNFTIPGGQIVTLLFLFMTVIGWYLSLPEKFDKRKFTVLLLANSLLWVYSTRVMMDVPVAFFLSLGLFQIFLFIENRKKKNYIISLILLSMALMTKEISILYAPIVYLYLIMKRDFNIKLWILAALPFIPYISYIIFTGPEEILWLLGIVAGTVERDYTYIPYGQLPAFIFISGIFGPGILSIIYMWKRYPKERKIRNLMLFTMVTYIVWEIFFDFVMPINLPRYHATLIPFLTLMISEASDRKTYLMYIYYLTLIYTASTGFLASYYFHIKEGAIWQNTFESFIEAVKFW